MAKHMHATHPAIVNRLKRAEGHLRKTIAMIEAERSCVDIAQQLHAIERAVAAAKKTLIHDHLDHCLTHASGSKDASRTVSELKLLSKYL